MKCPNCGAEIEGGHKFCTYCGSSLTAQMVHEQEQLNKSGCPRCGSTNITFNREKQGEVRYKKGTAVVRHTVGVCKDCGYTWQTTENAPKKRKTWLWVLGWIFIFPLPLTILMLRKKEMKPWLKYGIIALGWIIYLLIAVGGNSDTDTESEPPVSRTVITETEKPTETKKPAEKAPAVPVETKEPTQEAKATPTPNETESGEKLTTGQKNALKKAKDYLSFSAFSHDGLIEQLEFEQFSTEEATYAADNCGADWNEQALKKAKDYLSFSAFSYNGLIEQLEFEKYTTEQAEYGADHCGADWNEQAQKKAKDYLSFSSFSKQGLIEQLEFEGFTHEEAVYGAEQNGY